MGFCPFAMNALRRYLLVLCLLPVALPGSPAQAAQPASQAQSASGKAQVKPKAQQSARKAASKRAKSTHKKVSKQVAKPLPKTNLDLSLPTELVDNLQPNVGEPSPIRKRKPLLPPLFVEKSEADSPFQLNGRLISNEMQLQLRNDSRRDVEGAAIDFEYRQ
ncbi:hypothetical protein D884_00990 [Pseudomonas sp. URMO17WK12:I10]|jgi:hypothetical protein|nr:hypothetical protein F478_03054 [Pseudomonas sp. URIL14HWK12:I2]PZW59724.1 hypothetical protein F477_01159 [Pseudomonas sp. URIL14HWK12:I3]RDL15719.1 hypothetical protein F633_03888 [Pseudomonas sp. LAMO17WK12:I3]RED12365.1 hypothetical protein D884_00990 [Pseudomonas sp. URMO17WK12:I10]TFA87619.1 hypothetical protein F473_03793 [Pseudomonas sp. URIL14HWK12:I1]SNB80105.1 hypothetical protein SAMN02746026_03418 [Pseudomonas sp. LAIL14HWK12:I4]SOD06149.1 hypothetical protein SAMN05660967_006